MKIRSEQLDYLLRQEQISKQATTAPKESFGSFLDQEIGQAQAETMEMMPPPGARAGGIDPMLLASLESTEATQDVDSEIAQFMSQAGGSLDTLDSYAQTLGNAASPGRNAWDLLGTLDSQLSAMRDSMSRMPAGAAKEMESVVNELEVLAATEKFKFNRGDYI